MRRRDQLNYCRGVKFYRIDYDFLKIQRKTIMEVKSNGTVSKSISIEKDDSRLKTFIIQKLQTKLRFPSQFDLINKLFINLLFEINYQCLKTLGAL